MHLLDDAAVRSLVRLDAIAQPVRRRRHAVDDLHDLVSQLVGAEPEQGDEPEQHEAGAECRRDAAFLQRRHRRTQGVADQDGDDDGDENRAGVLQQQNRRDDGEHRQRQVANADRRTDVDDHRRRFAGGALGGRQWVGGGLDAAGAGGFRCVGHYNLSRALQK